MISKYSCALIFLSCLLYACTSPSNKQFLYFYEDLREGKSRFFMIKDSMDDKGNGLRFYYDHLDSNLMPTQAPRPLLFDLSQDTLRYMQLEWPLDLINTGSCHVFKSEPDKFPPGLSYRLCLRANLSDTTINGIPISRAALLERRVVDAMHAEPVFSVFDWNRNVVVEERSARFYIRLIRVDSLGG